MPIPDEQLARTQRSIWNDLVGRAWVRHADVHDRQAGPFGQAAMDALGVISGATIIDVGCGTGAAAAELVDRGAREVLGIDLSAPMIDAARASNTRPNCASSSATSLRSAALVTSTLCSPASESCSSTTQCPPSPISEPSAPRTPGSAFCCWGLPADNPWMTLPVMATVPVLGLPRLAGSGEPGPFSLTVARCCSGRPGLRRLDGCAG